MSNNINNYENSFIDAVEILTNKAIDSAEINKTIKATVIKSVDDLIGKYLIKYQDSRFYAYSKNIDTQYADGEEVYILVPNNDNKENKIILDRVNHNINNLVVSESISDYEIFGENCIDDISSFGLCSYKDEIKVLYDRENDLNLLLVNREDVRNYLSGVSRILCNFQIRTNLSSEQKRSGTYGIAFEFGANISNTQEIVLRTIEIDINQMIGNPYNFLEDTFQEVLYNIENLEIKYLNKIYIYCKDFPNKAEDKENDIFFSKIGLYGADQLEEEKLNSYYLVLETPGGNYFTEDETDGIKTIQAKLKIKGKEIQDSAIKYYWFKKNAQIVSTSEKYLPYGGLGWEFLGNEVSTSVYTIRQKDLEVKDTDIKCVAVHNSNNVSKTLTIRNYNAIDLKITSDLGTVFFYGIGNPTLTCEIPDREITEDYHFYWSVDNINGHFTLDETTEDNNIYNQTLKDYNQLTEDIKNEIKFPNANSGELQGYLDILNEYQYVQRVESNKIVKLQVNNIIKSSDYTCSVFYRNKLLGSASITIYNGDENSNYSLNIKNAEDIYLYDEKGQKPNKKILPLELELTNSQGVAIGTDILKTLDIDWVYPRESSMLKDIEIKDKYILNYDIQNVFNNNLKNNEIKAGVKLGDTIFTTTANIKFLKTGDIGTNGTLYTVEIVPNTDAIVNNPRIINGKLNYPEKDGKWFKVKIYKNGEFVYENTETGYDKDLNKYEIEWSIISDNSNIKYSKLEDIFSYEAAEDEDTKLNIANVIVRCYNGDNFQTSVSAVIGLPEVVQNNAYELSLEEGYNIVKYNSNGFSPQYSNSNFKVKLNKIINGTFEDISTKINSQGLRYRWSTGNTENDLLIIQDDLDLAVNEKRIIPVDYFNGSDLRYENIKLSVITNGGSEVASIIYPICFFITPNLNSNINDWDGNSLSIKDDGSSSAIYTPQLIVGKKESDNSFTGIAAGQENNLTGLFGYQAGEHTLFFNAETGDAIFGKNNDGQLTIDANSDKGLLFSHNYWKNYNNNGLPLNYAEGNKNGEGMLIDLTTPEITFGNGNLSISKNGDLNYKGALTPEGIYKRLVGQIGTEDSPLSFGLQIYDANSYWDRNSDSYYTTRYIYGSTVITTDMYIPENFTITKATCYFYYRPQPMCCGSGVRNITDSNVSLTEHIQLEGCTKQKRTRSEGHYYYETIIPNMYHTGGSSNYINNIYIPNRRPLCQEKTSFSVLTNCSYYGEYLGDKEGSYDSIIPIIQTNLIDNFGLYLFENDSVENWYYVQDVTWHYRKSYGYPMLKYRNFKSKDATLLSSQEGFSDIRGSFDKNTLSNPYNTHQTRIIDFTESAKKNLKKGDINCLGFSLLDIPSGGVISDTNRSTRISDTLTTVSLDAYSRSSIVFATIIIEGYEPLNGGA